jgi:hypothetical protein
MKNIVSLQRGDQRGEILNPESAISYVFLCLIFFFSGFLYYLSRKYKYGFWFSCMEIWFKYKDIPVYTKNK